MLKLTALLLSVILAISCNADSTYVRKITDTLCSSNFFGRGYVNSGMHKAASFISSEMKHIGLTVREQSFEYPVNTFPGDMKLSVNGISLTAGSQFLVDAKSIACKSHGVLEYIDSNNFVNRQNHVLVQKASKLTWTVSTEQSDYSALQLKGFAGTPAYYDCNIQNEFDKHFKATNIAGIVEGSVRPDSFFVFTSHYDHLGAMGDSVYFPGANDNAAGVATMLDLAKCFSAHHSSYSVLFIAFAGEEAGLIGSKYFTEHPLIDLKKIKFLVNLDLVGTGDEGITVVNASEYPAEYNILQDINKNEQLLSSINSRGKAANSDHYWFTEKGVSSFFIYTMGKRKDYHDIYDVASTLPLNKINDLEKMLLLFTERLSENADLKN